MTRLRKLTACSTILGMLCILLSGCTKATEPTPKMSAEQLVLEMKSAVGEQEITYEAIDVGIEASYGAKMEGFTMSIGILLDLELEQWISPEPFASCSKGTMKLEALTQDYEYRLEDYRLEEDGKIISYSYDGMTDEWMKEESALEPSDYYDEYFSEVTHLEPDFENAVLQEEKVTLGAKEAYVLQGVCNGEDVKELLDNLGFFEDFDFQISVEALKQLKLPVICYIDGETYLPLQIELEPAGMMELVKELFTSEIELSEESTEEEYFTEVEECHLIIKNIGFNNQDIPSVPENAKHSFSILDVLEFAGGHLGDGSFLLFSGSKVAGMNPDSLEGYQVVEYITEQSVVLESDDKSKLIIFEAMSEAAAHQYFENTEDALILIQEGLDLDIQMSWKNETVSTNFGDIDVYCVTDPGGLVLYNTVISTDHMSVCISAVDTIGEWNDTASVITPLADTLSEVTVDSLPYLGYASYADFDGKTMLEMVAEAVKGRKITYAEARFSDLGIYLMREEGIGIEAGKENELSAEVFAGGYIQWNDRVSLGLFSGEDMYSMTVLYPGEALGELITFCNPFFVEHEITSWSSVLEGTEIITYFIIDPDTNLPVQVMFDISEINDLFHINKKYLILDRIGYEP